MCNSVNVFQQFFLRVRLYVISFATSDSLPAACCFAVECTYGVKQGAIPDMIIKMICKCGQAGSKATPRSIKPEPWKPLLALALDMFMFQLHHVKQPPTYNVFVWVPL